jgi:hypothetical protein
MEMSFGETLRRARKTSRYPRGVDFTKIAGITWNKYRTYESGVSLPSISTLEKIIQRCCLSEEAAKNLIELRAIAIIRRHGVTMKPLPATLNVSELAEKIQREVEYELKRAQLQVTTHTRQVCTRRIEMLLKDALGIQ